MNTKTAKTLAHKNYLLAEICWKLIPTDERGRNRQLCSFKLVSENGKYVIKLSNETISQNERLYSTLKTTDSRGKFHTLEFDKNEIEEFLPLLNTSVYLLIGNVMGDTNPVSIKFRAFLFDIILKNSLHGIYTRKRHYFGNDSIYPILNSCELNPNTGFVKSEKTLTHALMAA